MTKKHLIALANAIRKHNEQYPANAFTIGQICVLGDFCKSQNSEFKADRWQAYIKGECGPNGGLLWWTESLGRIELQMTLEDAKSVSHSGPCDEDVSALRKVPYIAEQLNALKPATVRATLEEYGAWDADELADHDTNLDRIIWIAGADIQQDEQLEQERAQ